MLDVVFKNLWARKMRSALCVLAVMVSVFLNGTTLTMNKWMYETMTSELAKYMGKIFVQQEGSGYPPIDSSIKQETAEAILAHSESLGVNPVESAPLLFIRTERGMMPFMPAKEMIIGIPPGKENVLIGSVEAMEGVNHFPGEQGDVAILGIDAAVSFGASVGQDVTINGQHVRVIGILKRSSMDSVNISALLPLEAVQRLFAQDGIVSALLLTPDDINRTSEIGTVLREEYPALEVVTQDDMLAEAQNVMRMPMAYMNLMSVTGFVVAVAVIMSTMIMAVMERTREFGTLRALGSRRRLIMGMVFSEALFLALIGGLPSIGFVLMMSRWMSTSPPTMMQLLQVVGVAIIAAMVAGFYPAWRAAQVSPVEALRYE